MERRETIAQTLRASGRALIVCHVNPDGDCLGSALALAAAMDRIGVPSVVACDDGVPASLAFLPGASRVVRAVPEDDGAPTAVTLECSSLDRAGRLASAVRSARTIVAIDHHAEPTPYAHLTDWDPDAAAVGEQIADLIPRLGVAIDRPIATCLLAALVTDTGVFRYANTTPRVLRLAAALIERGASVHEIVRAVYEEQPSPALRLLGRALAAHWLCAEGAVAVTVITPAMLDEAGAASDAATGIAAALRTITGVRLALVLEDHGGTVRVSIRARDGVRADQVAHELDGGGHAGAAGAEIVGGAEVALERALAAAARAVGRDARDG